MQAEESQLRIITQVIARLHNPKHIKVSENLDEIVLDDLFNREGTDGIDKVQFIIDQ